MLNKNKDNLHPQDFRNLIIFAIVSILLWSLYEIYVLQPARDNMQKRAHIEKVIAQKELETGVNIIPEVLALPRDEVLNETQRLSFKNDQIFGTINLQGGRIDDLMLAKFHDTLEKKNNVELLSPKDTEYPRFVDFGWISKDANIKLPNAMTRWSISGNDQLSPGNPVILKWDNGQGLVFEREYALDENYAFAVTQSVKNNTAQSVQLFPYGLVTQTGLPEHFQDRWIMHEGPIGFLGEELMQVDYSTVRQSQKIEKDAATGWIGLTDKYWLTALVPQQGDLIKYRFNYSPNIKNKDKGRFQIDYTGRGLDIPAGQMGVNKNHLFAGAKEVLKLDEYEEKLDAPNFNLAVDFGWFWFMTQPFFYILHYLHEAIGNMGIAIICLTVLIRMAVFPLTNTSYRSFAKMKKVSPQIIELRDRHGDDKQKLQQEIIQLYQSEGVNPMAGCLPILIQIPIFFSLYKVFFVTIEMRHAPFFGWIQDLSAPDPTSFVNLFGLLDFTPPSFLMIGVWPCLMLMALLVQKKLNPPPPDKFQRDMMNMFPFFIAYIMSGFASGLVIYWTFSALISIMQQMFIMHRLGVPIYLLGQSEEEEKLEEAVEKGPDVHPLAEMAKEEVEDAMFGNDDDMPEVTPPKPKKSKKRKK